MKLWYNKPAERWQETLPIGNGSLGGMIFGNPRREIVGINEESLWSGFYRDKNNPEAISYLSKVRTLIFEKKYAEAEEMIRKHMLGEYNESYLPLGNLIISQRTAGDYKNYIRQLEAAVTEGNMELRIAGKCPEHVDPNYVEERPENWIQGTRGMDFSGSIRVISCDGDVKCEEKSLKIRGAGEVVLALTAVREGRLEGKTYEQLRKEHIRVYQKLEKTSRLTLGEEPDLPTDIRLQRLREGAEDTALYALYYQYGRYLLISSSRKGSLPANLQGIWSWEKRAPWSSNWTTNINTQMNYWPVHICNLEPCMEPFYPMMEKLCREGRKTAAIHHNCRGFVHHHNADFWGNTNPVGKIWGADEGQKGSVTWSFWPMGGIWLTNEMYQAYSYERDPDLLREKIYPVLREAVLFAVDWLIPWNGYYVTCPSTSPENRYSPAEGEDTCLTVASAMDLALIRQLFVYFRQACGDLGLEDPLLKEVTEREEKMMPFRIGSDRRLLEWLEEVKEPEPGHRHVSHLCGLFPGEIFRDDRELTAAARKSLEYRLEHGGGHTGWSCAWIINLWAVLGEGEKAGEFLEILLKRSTYDNLWDAHPPFQIDGNFGGTAGMAHMLLQTENHRIRILPAVPGLWKCGKVTGLRGKGDITADIQWNGGFAEAVITAGYLPFSGIVAVKNQEQEITLKPYEKKTLRFNGV